MLYGSSVSQRVLYFGALACAEATDSRAVGRVDAIDHITPRWWAAWPPSEGLHSRLHETRRALEELCERVAESTLENFPHLPPPSPPFRTTGEVLAQVTPPHEA